MGGDLPQFEAMSRALFAGDDAELRQILESWPTDVRAHALRMLAEDPRFDATALQTVGVKGWDGMALALIV